MARRARTLVGRVVVGLVLAALLAGGGLAYTQRQVISDHFSAQSFQPTPEVAALAEDLRLTDAGRRIFLATHPTLDASQQFNEQCAQVDHSEQGHVLGCYASGSIHLFKVMDQRLAEIVEVTAAHELLHAAYSRLGASERESLAERLADVYDSIVQADPALGERMAVYEALSPAAFANELHSVLGTEARELPEWLDQHYQQWFEDRRLLLDFFDAYHSVFEQLQGRAHELEAAMGALREDVERRNREYEAAVEGFNGDAEQFRRRNEAYEFSDDLAGFQAVYAELEARRGQLEAQLAGLRADIARYEQMRTELQQLSQTSAELDQHLNSDLAPPPTQASG